MPGNPLRSISLISSTVGRAISGFSGMVSLVAQPELRRVVVVGASLAGLRACETLRAEGFGGAITLIGAETHLPYDRPPLSKKLLAGEWEPDRIALRKPDDLESLGLDRRLGVPAAGLDLAARSVLLADGAEVPFDGVVLATGAAPRRLPDQGAVASVHELRTLDDALRLRAEVLRGDRPSRGDRRRVHRPGGGGHGPRARQRRHRARGRTGAADPRPRPRVGRGGGFRPRAATASTCVAA